MVTKALRLEDRCVAGTAGQVRGRQLVVQAPAHILRIGLATVAPPGVGAVGGIGMQSTIDIHQAAFTEQLGHPGALLGQEAGILHIALPVFQVDLLVRNIHIATQDEFTLGSQRLQMRIDRIKKAKLSLLPFLTGGAAGKVAADQGKLGSGRVKAQLEVAAFIIKFGYAQADHHIGGGKVGVDPHSRIALFLRKVKVTLQAGQLLEPPGNVVGLGLDFLHANTIRLVRLNPLRQPLAGGRSDAIEIEAA